MLYIVLGAIAGVLFFNAVYILLDSPTRVTDKTARMRLYALWTNSGIIR
jgi:energy-coupling factor transporter ATP-binding protein EcfA2